MSITSRLYYPADVPFTGKAGTKSNWKSRTSDYRYQEKWTDKADYQVVFLRDGQIVETNNFNISK